MNKKIIISFLIVFLILSFFTFKIYATENTENENEPQAQSDEPSDTTTSSEENNVTYRPQSSNSDSYYVTSVSPISSQYEANLELNNILSILLISVGILLILFSIALLIRLKK